MKETYKTYGDTSKFLSESNNMFAKVNGGTMEGVMKNQYMKDYMIEKSLRDIKFDKLRQDWKKKDKRRNTLGCSMREVDVRRKLIIRESK